MIPSPTISALDHLVLTVNDLAETVSFYQTLGMKVERFSPKGQGERLALRFGDQKINLHQKGAEFLPNAQNAGIGTSDLCLLSDTPLVDWVRHLTLENINVSEGPVPRTGATGPIVSIYLRDPDGNLIEISNAA